MVILPNFLSSLGESSLLILLFFFFLVFLSFFLRATPAAYGDSQARGPIGAVATGLHHSHSNTGPEPCLQPTPQPQQHRILNPLSEARDRTQVFMSTIPVRYCLAMKGTPVCIFS